MNRRLRAASIHFLVSAGVSCCAAVLVFFVWYPQPYAELAGGMALFGLLVCVDVVLGPTLTSIVASPSKPLRELRRDIALIALVQLAAFAYGMYTIALARPVHMVFEVDRFVVVTAADIDPAELAHAPVNLRKLSWMGPSLIATAKSQDSQAMLRSLEKSFSGVDISKQPDHWIEYAKARELTWKASKPIQSLVKKNPEVRSQLDEFASRAGVPLDTLRFLPLTSRKTIWTAVIAQPDSRIVGYLPVDGFL